MIRHSLFGCSVDQLAPRAISYWQLCSVIRRVKPYNQNADRRDDEVIAFDWSCPLLMLWTAPPPARECHEYGCC
jgi:hypothetical protein